MNIFMTKYTPKLSILGLFYKKSIEGTCPSNSEQAHGYTIIIFMQDINIFIYYIKIDSLPMYAQCEYLQLGHNYS